LIYLKIRAAPLNHRQLLDFRFLLLARSRAPSRDLPFPSADRHRSSIREDTLRLVAALAPPFSLYRLFSSRSRLLLHLIGLFMQFLIANNFLIMHPIDMCQWTFLFGSTCSIRWCRFPESFSRDGVNIYIYYYMKIFLPKRDASSNFADYCQRL